MNPGETFIHGGANVGLFTLTAAASVGPTGSVVAFEPAAETRRLLTRNIALIGFDWVTVRPEGLDRESTHRSFVAFEGDAAGLSSFAPESAAALGTLVDIKTCTLDDALGPGVREAVSLVKLDLEGAEYAALLGAQSLLANGSADLLLELEPGHLERQGATALELVSLLRGFGFDFYRVEDDGQGHIGLVRDPRPEIRGERPNILATKTAERARRAGIPVQGLQA
ncbi:MAG: FkbM family methyltransferase [Rhodothermales bacterium]